MSERKGPWRCRECGEIQSGRRGDRCAMPNCWGIIGPHDRRDPDPEKAALKARVEELEKLLERAKDCILWPGCQCGLRDRQMVDEINAALRPEEER